MVKNKRLLSFIAVFIVAILSYGVSCGIDCFEGVRILGYVTEKDRRMIYTIEQIMPETLRKTVNCTEVFIYYTPEEWNAAMRELGHRHTILGLCRHDGNYHQVHVRSLVPYEAFVWVVIHELCHAVGYDHGDEMDKAINAVWAVTMEIIYASEEP